MRLQWDIELRLAEPRYSMRRMWFPLWSNTKLSSVFASMRRPIVRRRGASLIGHASVRTQLRWCGQENVPKAIITHCGSQPVRANTKAVEKAVRDLGSELRLRVQIAFDGMELVLP